MNYKLPKTLEKLQEICSSLVPFLVLGMGISLIIGLLIVFSYVLIWGMLIGGVLWIIFIIKKFFFPPKTITKMKGRIIEHSDHK